MPDAFAVPRSPATSVNIGGDDTMGVQVTQSDGAGISERNQLLDM